MVRDPPRKSAEATYRAICSRGQRAQRRRREPTACTERRFRNGRRWRYSVWIFGSQRQRLRRLLAESSSGGQTGSSKSLMDLQTLEVQHNHRKVNRIQKSRGVTGVKSWFQCSDCKKGGSIASHWRIIYGWYSRCKICMNFYLAVSSTRNLRLVNTTGMGSSGLRHLFILLGWITGLDGGFAHASYITLIVPLTFRRTCL